VEIFFELCPAEIIGITGSNGKSTTTALTAYLLESAKREKVWLSGNIGNEPMLGLLERIGANDLVVLELSSFQLEQLGRTGRGPIVSLLTNLTPNHLDRHGTLENYCAAKENIFRLQKLDGERPAVSIFNGEDAIAERWFEKYKAQEGRVCVKYAAYDVSERVAKRFGLPGRANRSNLAGAMAVAQQFGVGERQVEKCLAGFKGLAHRLELVAEVGGVRWYNDSIATTPESAMAALEAFDEPKVIIAGGYDKGVAFDELGEVIGRRAKAAILIGVTARKIADAIEKSKKLKVKRQNVNESATDFTEDTEKNIKAEVRSQNSEDRRKEKEWIPAYAGMTEGMDGMNIVMADSLAEAVSMANEIAAAGDVVILSPACASYDMFDNFQQRGREFVKLVMEKAG
jgi:UDP-N-acetylmuramoylalanine--D-glutamate ligase